MTDTRKRSGLSSDRAFKLQRKLESRLTHIISNAAHFKRPFDEISEKVHAEVFNQADFNRLPAYSKGYIKGIYDATKANLWTKTAWVLSIDGKLLTSKDVEELYQQEKAIPGNNSTNPEYRSPWARVDQDLSRHVWMDEKGNPLLDRPVLSRHLEAK